MGSKPRMSLSIARTYVAAPPHNRFRGDGLSVAILFFVRLLLLRTKAAELNARAGQEIRSLAHS